MIVFPGKRRHVMERLLSRVFQLSGFFFYSLSNFTGDTTPENILDCKNSVGDNTGLLIQVLLVNS